MSDRALPGGTEQQAPDPERAFEREKWLAEIAFRQRELDLKAKEQERLGKELDLKLGEARRNRLSSPLVLAVIGAALATVGNAVVTWENGVAQRALEDGRAISALTLENTKAESDRLLEVIKTDDPDKAAINLQFLLDAGLIQNQQTATYLRKYLATRVAGQGPSLPSPSAAGSTDLPGSLSSNELQGLMQRGVTLGIDLSSHSGRVDYAALHGRNVAFVYLRASQGASSIDQTLPANATQAQQNGLRVGLYHVFDARADVTTQFANFADRLRSTKWSLPPAVDVEDAGPAAATADFCSKVKQFLLLVKSGFAVAPTLYVGGSFARECAGSELAEFPLWIARYNHGATFKIPDGWPDYTFWQVAQNVSDDPLLSALDIDVFKGDLASLDALSRATK